MVFCFSHKKVLKYPILFCFLTSTKFGPKKGPKKGYFFLPKKGAHKKKKRYVATPFFQQFFESKNIDVEQKTQIKIRKKQRQGKWI